MKKRRQAKILEIISKYETETQEDLQKYLREAGFEVTQATISRDIKELRLVKAHTSSGKYVYSTGKSTADDNFGRIGGIFNEAIVKVQHAMNIVCIKCFSGMANAACTAVDSMQWEGVVGTIAGDDTIFVLCRSEREAQIFAVNLEKMINA